MLVLMRGVVSGIVIGASVVAMGSGHRESPPVFFDVFASGLTFDPSDPGTGGGAGISLDILDAPRPDGELLGGVDFFPVSGNVPLRGQFQVVPGDGSAHPDSFFDIFLDLGDTPQAGDLPDQVSFGLEVIFFDPATFLPGTVITDQGGVAGDSFFDVFFEVNIVGGDDPLLLDLHGQGNDTIETEIVSMDLRGLGPNVGLLEVVVDTSGVSLGELNDPILHVDVSGFVLSPGIPEPASLGLLVLSSGMMLRRRG